MNLCPSIFRVCVRVCIVVCTLTYSLPVAGTHGALRPPIRPSQARSHAEPSPPPAGLDAARALLADMDHATRHLGEVSAARARCSRARAQLYAHSWPARAHARPHKHACTHMQPHALTHTHATARTHVQPHAGTCTRTAVGSAGRGRAGAASDRRLDARLDGRGRRAAAALRRARRGGAAFPPHLQQDSAPATHTRICPGASLRYARARTDKHTT